MRPKMSVENPAAAPPTSEISPQSPPQPQSQPQPNLTYENPSQSTSDGGFAAWTQVFGAFLVFWNIWFFLHHSYFTSELKVAHTS
jgi:hypothetical protein